MRPHIHNWALGALAEMSGETKSEIARRSVLTPGAFADLISGRRAGLDEQIRGRVAEALGVSPKAITCWCDDRVGNHAQEGQR